MNITTIGEFSSCLQRIDTKSGYVSLGEGGHFALVDSKDSKTLRTADIAAKGQEALDLLGRARGSYQDKSHYYEDLGKGLRDYESRLWAKKSIWQKMGWYLRQRDPSDNKIHQEAKAALAQAERLRHEDNRINRAITYNQRAVQNELQKPEIRMRLFYHSVLDSSRYDTPALRGLPFYTAAPWMLNHLEAYRAQFPSSHPWVPTIDSLIKELKEEMRMDAAALEATRSMKAGAESPFMPEEVLGQPFKPIDSIQDWIYSELSTNIRGLRPGEEYLLQGGYNKSLHTESGHAMRVSFVRQADGSTQMSFVNTGEGAEPATTSWKTVKQSGKELLRIAVGKEVLSRRMTQDDVWTGIPPEAFNDEFFKLLVLPIIGDQRTDMAQIKAAIDAYLSARYPGVRHVQGRTHKLQNKGSCVTKSLTAHVHGRMDQADPHMFRHFKVFYTDREMAALPRLLDEMQAPIESRRVMMEEAQAVRAKRFGKANPGLLQRLFR